MSNAQKKPKCRHNGRMKRAESVKNVVKLNEAPIAECLKMKKEVAHEKSNQQSLLNQGRLYSDEIYTLRRSIYGLEKYAEMLRKEIKNLKSRYRNAKDIVSFTESDSEAAAYEIDENSDSTLNDQSIIASGKYVV